MCWRRYCSSAAFCVVFIACSSGLCVIVVDVCDGGGSEDLIFVVSVVVVVGGVSQACLMWKECGVVMEMSK